MKWKKFFYRLICQDEDSRMCLAPSCSECCDFEGCFGDESGESILARTRLGLEKQGWIASVSLAPR
jgi:nitrogen fixation protein NifQ